MAIPLANTKNRKFYAVSMMMIGSRLSGYVPKETDYEYSFHVYDDGTVLVVKYYFRIRNPEIINLIQAVLLAAVYSGEQNMAATTS